LITLLIIFYVQLAEYYNFMVISNRNTYDP